MIVARNLLPAGVVALAVLLLTAPWSTVTGASADQSAAGTWIMRYGPEEGNTWSYPLYRVESVTPVDASGVTLAYVGVDSNPWGSGGPAPGGHVSDHVGTFTRTGPNTFEYTIIYHEAGDPGYPPEYCPPPHKGCVERAKLTVIWVWKGTALVSGDAMVKYGDFLGYHASDCNNDDQADDLCKDGVVPVAGAKPFYSIKWGTRSVRVR